MASFGPFFTALRQEFSSATKSTRVKSLVTILVLLAVEKLLTATNFYKCPERDYKLYGGAFLFGPAFCLSLLTLASSNPFWDGVVGLCKGKFRHSDVFQKISNAFARAAFLGFVWLVLAFGTTEFYVCFRVGGKQSKARIGEMKTQSTLLAWSFLVISVVLALVYFAFQKCCFSYRGIEMLPSPDEYQRIEREKAFSTFQTEMKLLAEQEGEQRVKKILDEAKEGENSFEIMRKAKTLLEARYKRQSSDETGEDTLKDGTNLDETRSGSNTICNGSIGDSMV